MDLGPGQPMQQKSKVPKPPEHYYKIDAFESEGEKIPETEVKITVFMNRVMVIITQKNRLGDMIQGEIEDNDPGMLEKTYEIKKLFGANKDTEQGELYCRAILEVFNNKLILAKKAKDIGREIKQNQVYVFAGKTVLLSLCLQQLKEENNNRAVFKAILDSLKKEMLMFLE